MSVPVWVLILYRARCVCYASLCTIELKVEDIKSRLTSMVTISLLAHLYADGAMIISLTPTHASVLLQTMRSSPKAYACK